MVADRGGGVIATAALENDAVDLGGVAAKSPPEEESYVLNDVNGQSSTSSSSPAKVKEEVVEVEEVVGARDCEFGAARPMAGLQEVGPPPFLKKTFEMVDATETDGVVSWSEGRDSFVVWDSHEFSKNLLPKFFKHSNFSSFIRQLNTYGFRKVDPDRWEFANEGFQGGKKHLLKNIKRRSKYNTKHNPQSTLLLGLSDSARAGLLESEIDTLRKDQNTMKMEILNLRQQHKDSQKQLIAVEERIRCSECKQHQMLLFLTKTLINPAFLQQLVHKRRLKRELGGVGTGKRMRLLSTPTPSTEMQSFLTENFPESLDTEPERGPFSSVASDVFSVNAMPENLLDDMSMLDEELAVSDSRFYNELEDLIERPRDRDHRDWGCYNMTGLVEQTGWIGSIL